MSLDLNLKIPKPVKMSRFASSLNTAFIDLLGLQLSVILNITVEEPEGENRHPLQTQWVKAPLHLTVSIRGSHTVEIMVIRYADVLSENLPSSGFALSCEDFEMQAEVSVRGLWRISDPIKWTLGAACAIALARETGSKIIDESLAWNDIHEQNDVDFIENLKRKNELLLIQSRNIIEVEFLQR